MPTGCCPRSRNGVLRSKLDEPSNRCSERRYPAPLLPVRRDRRVIDGGFGSKPDVLVTHLLLIDSARVTLRG